MTYGTLAIDRRALDDVRYYLRAWRWWCIRWRPDLGYPHASPIVTNMLPVVSWDSEEDQRAELDQVDEEVDEQILHKVDQAIELLPVPKRMAVKAVYLRECCLMPIKAARRLCNEAEVDLIAMLRRKNVLLGGY